MDQFSQGEKRPWPATEEDQIEWCSLDQTYQTDAPRRPRFAFEPDPLTFGDPFWCGSQFESAYPGIEEAATSLDLPQIIFPEQDVVNQNTWETAFPSSGDWFALAPEALNSELTYNSTVAESHVDESPCAPQETVSPYSNDSNPLDDDYDTCLGMVEINEPVLRLNDLGDENSTRIDVTLKFEGALVTVRHYNSMKYGGLVRHQVADVLIYLSEDFRVTFVVFLLLKRVTKKKPPQCKLFVVLHGLREDADDIGEVLSNSGLYLQPPQSFAPSVPYFNPQYLYRPGSDENIIQAQDFFGNHTISSTLLTENDPLKCQVLQVFDSADGPTKYSGTSVSQRLRTPLKYHQMKALSMIIEKETGKIEGNEFGSLWAPLVVSSGETRYKNIITGLICPDPPVSLGGLLADEMGLGKTLSMLSLITKYLDIVEEAVCSSSEAPVRTTLVVTPMSLLQTWEEQINRHIHPQKISYYVYHGSARRKAFVNLAPNNYDIVLTTYDTIALEECRENPDASVNTKKLTDFEWCRIVLYEAHMIKNASSKRYQALMALRAQRRWCLTGSPMFNRVEDFGSLLSFLRAAPFHDPSVFSCHVSNPLKRYPERGLQNLRQIVQAVSLRRTKASVFGELEIPPRQIRVQDVLLNEEERQLYDILKQSYARIFMTNSLLEKDSKFTHCIFQSISRLRQFCDHGRDLLPHSAQAVFDDSFDGDMMTSELMRASSTCAGCLAALSLQKNNGTEDPNLECGHSLCARCQRKNEDGAMIDSGSCKVCSANRTPAHSPGTFSSYPQPFDPMAIDNIYKPSSKVKALVGNLQAEIMEPVTPPIKSVVFSCWTKMLDQVEKTLKMNRLQFERVDGSKSDSQRRSAIERFRTHDDCKILLASIGSAGVGLDLTVASRVHLLEPQWSPMAEEQALDRVHRMGQTREVVATKYVVKNSIEEYVISLQEMKSRVIKQSLEHSESIDTLSARERFMKYLEEP